ncbi:AbrB/MazE/SpoVT family DNA-binding domain-containing protein [Lysinibacillus sp. K60]|uniref:AbrB/MazE/SpoVT family DNA-binding domain-containing protein n=1 Tax=Lysinibacillus sp. K60 TaxID=2720027 RepID=UPI001C8C469F|nr:AbrB/MazE/SpoVT family DNA-binding domain-containing protein [Lysinibacillus sp. K60]MBX8946838.1 AbrB/MazE/SpoVT family DNA-binding domain-containing protein [Lysinibacillus sp. K60]
MKSTGIVRKVDELGRIVIPRELRRTLEINEKDPVEIFIDGEEIILRKFVSNTACIVTGEITTESFTLFNNITLSPKGAEILLGTLEKK